MQVALNYGRGKLPLSLPEEWTVSVIGKRPMPVIADPRAAIAAAVAAPMGVPALSELARRSRTACILICDITRPVPNGLFLPILVRTLLAAGLAARDIKILVATGLHRPNEGEELAEIVGDAWVMEIVEVLNHLARDDAAHRDIGRTRGGTVVKLDHRFLDADLRIATGLVEPHFMAGYSGGRKVIAPGIAHKDTITTFHSARFMEHPRCANCVLDGNPLHEEQMEIMRMIGGALALNTVIDAERRLSYVSFGEIGESHRAAVDFIRDYAVVPVARRFKTVVASAAGYPLDKTYYQTVKGMVGPMDILEPGGTLILASECSEGMGSREFVAAQRRLIAQGPERFLAEIETRTHAEIDEWQTEMQLKPMRIGSIQLYSGGLSPEERALTGVTVIDDLAGAIAASVAASGDTHIAVVPEGPYVIPAYRPTHRSGISSENFGHRREH